MKHIPKTPFTAARSKNRRLYIYDAAGEAICSGFGDVAQPERVAARLALAANKTYGAGINPESVPELLNALKNLINHANEPKSEHKWKVIDAANKAIEQSKL